MRLCLVSLDFAPARSSGLTVYAERLAHRLVSAGHIVTVIAAHRPGTFRRTVSDNLCIERIPIGYSDWITYSWWAARYVEKLQCEKTFNIVHFLDVHFAWAYRGSFVASLLQSFRQRLTADNGQPYASSRHNRLFRKVYYTVARKWMEQTALRRADGFVALSCATRDEFVNHYKISPQKITVVPEAVDLLQFAPQETVALRQRLGLQNNRIIVYVGFSTPRKGLEYLAAGLHLLPSDVRLIIIGRWDLNYRARVIATAGSAWQYVIELGDVPDVDIPCYLSLADLVVLPSLLEGFGLPALEALACGTPVVATMVGALAEVIGSCGALVPPRDTSALIEAIISLLNNDERLNELRIQARQRAISLFHPSRAYDGIMQFYQAYGHIDTDVPNR